MKMFTINTGSKKIYKAANKPLFGQAVYYTPSDLRPGQYIDPIRIVGYTVVGSPTIIGNIVSGFSTSNYVKTAQQVALGQDYEIATAFSVPDFNNYNCIVGAVYNGTNSSAFTFQVEKNARIAYWMPNETSGTIKHTGTKTLTANTKYFIKATCLNGSFVSMISTDGINYTQDCSFTQENQIASNYVSIGNVNNAALVMQGYIDLNNTYIKVNGEYFFRGDMPSGTASFNQSNADYRIENGELVYANPNIYLTGPVNYTKVGSPTIADNVASGFSENDYIEFSQSVDPKQITEMVTKINIPSSAIGLNRYMNVISKQCQLSIYSAQPSQPQFFYTGFNFNGMGTLYIQHTLEPDTDYWIRYASDGTNSTASWSTDGINYTVGDTKPTNTITDNPNGFIFGKRGNSYIFPGTIDFKQTYIKVNGALWFYGKILSTEHIAPVPAGFTYGNTTATANGFVDMRTQVFTPAPTGATIVKGE